MKTRYVIILTASAAALAATTPFARSQNAEQAGGMLQTMPHGTYQCALPGDASGEAFQIVESAQFRLGAASSYRTAEGRGTYILKGNSLTFTRGPKKGERMRKVGSNQLQAIDEDGALSKMICTRLGRTDR